MSTGIRAVGVAILLSVAVACSSSGPHPPQVGTITGTLGTDQGLTPHGLTPRAGTVTATPTAGGPAVTVRTDPHGSYVLRLPTGLYRLTSHIGSVECFSANVSPVDVHPGQTISDDVGCAS